MSYIGDTLLYLISFHCDDDTKQKIKQCNNYLNNRIKTDIVYVIVKLSIEYIWDIKLSNIMGKVLCVYKNLSVARSNLHILCKRNTRSKYIMNKIKIKKTVNKYVNIPSKNSKVLKIVSEYCDSDTKVNIKKCNRYLKDRIEDPYCYVIIDICEDQWTSRMVEIKAVYDNLLTARYETINHNILLLKSYIMANGFTIDDEEAFIVKYIEKKKNERYKMLLNLSHDQLCSLEAYVYYHIEYYITRWRMVGTTDKSHMIIQKVEIEKN